MSNGRHDELEARVARLERLLNQVLGLVQELKVGKGEPTQASQEEVQGETLEAAGVAAGVEETVPPRTAESEAEPPAPADAIPREPTQIPPKPAPPRPEQTSAPPTADTKTTWNLPPQARPGPKFKSGLDLLEELGIYPLRGVFLARLGIFLLLLSVAYFFKYSIDQGWLVPAIRLAIGLVAGAALVVLGFKGASKGEPLGTVLAGGGIATFFITGYTGHQWYSLVSYPVAFGFLFAASVLGIFLSLRSGLQALALVGLIGALATPLILTARTAEVAGLAFYVSLIVASVAAIYLLKAWRALLISAVVTAWAVLWLAVGGTSPSQPGGAWTVQGAVAFSALAFWLVPLYRAVLRVRNPGKWPRPISAYPETPGGFQVAWNVHLDALSLLMPLTAIGFSTWIWDLSRFQLGWVFLSAAVLAQGIGWWVARSQDPEDSAGTQRYVAILLSTIGLGLVLTGDMLYLAFIAEAVALFAVAARKRSPVLFVFGVAVQLLVLGAFLLRLALGGLIMEGALSPLLDLAAICAAALIGARFMGERGRQVFFIGAYLGLLAFTARELSEHPSLLYLAYLVEALGTQVLASRLKDRFLEGLSYVAFGLVVMFFVFGLQSGRTVLAGDLTLLVDIAAILGTVYLGMNAPSQELRRGFFVGAYLGLLILFGRELIDHSSILYLTFLVVAVVTQLAAARQKSPFWVGVGHIPMLAALGFFANGMEVGRNLLAGDITSLMDLAAIGGTVYIGTLLTGRQGRRLYLFAAYACLLIWMGRELYPFQQGQALMSLAFGMQGTAVLVAGFLMDRPVLQKTGVATLLLVVSKVLLVDMAAVEPIWRVLLLFIFGGLFLLLSKFVQGRKPSSTGDENPDEGGGRS